MKGTEPRPRSRSGLVATSLRKSFGPTVALSDASVRVEPGEVVALIGASGSGKTTLLYCLAGLVEPDAGTVVHDGVTLTDLSRDEATRIRRENFGFVFQFAELVPELTIAENIALPLELQRARRDTVRARVDQLLTRLDISELGDRKPDQVSGGQAQRAAVARALCHRPAVVFADEPTGALDSANGHLVLTALMELARDSGSAVVLVTHDDKVAASTDRRLVVHDGRCADEGGS